VLQAVLLVILIFVCVALVGVILLQRSEGGALGMGGGPSGFMSTRGVGDLLTRTTSVLAGVFFVLCLSLTLIIGRAHRGDAVVDRLKIEGLDPAALARKQAAQPSGPSTNTTVPGGPAPGAPILEAPPPQLPGAPGPILTPAPSAAPAKPQASVHRPISPAQKGAASPDAAEPKSQTAPK
jgi:preprotein translocase subunit SecG